MLKRLLRQFKWKRKSEEEAETPVKKDKVMGYRYITYNERLNEKLNEHSRCCTSILNVQ